MINTPVKKNVQTEQKFTIQEFIRQLEEEPDFRRRLAAALVKEQQETQPLRMTYAGFLEWADEDTLAEWVNGEVIMSSPASLPHQNIVGFLYELLKSYAFFHNLGTVIQAPFQMKLEQGREPDVLFIAQKHEDRLKTTYLDGPADLVVEVISPESAGRDRGDKFYEYERGGVPEYWLIDPLMQRAEFYQIDSTTRRYTVMSPETEGAYRSAVLPGFWLRVDCLWQNPLPHPLQMLGEIAGIAPQELERFLKLLQGQ